MRSGELDRKITIEKVSSGRTSAGAYTETWSKRFDRWANVRERHGGEEQNAEQKHVDQEFVFTVRHSSSILITDRIVYHNEYYDIMSIKELGRKEWLELQAKRLWQT